ncbi:2-oxo acid dehydrogenase subunit E2 [Burkholderia cepacia]|uniref:Dihydrolipoamide acetyltransferase component of pyruvate dehydrogenase complex n=1 Tax=Burkholderia cepacia TaxID=292 RepID=A0A2S8I5J1_BURCE|nr:MULTISPECIES: dihydrolipoamide acetyltransferase family protein [Burkholderia]AWV05464.1 2-oxo acid dehydrogenase subunit E2 [Burkholderia sp. JP2-270]PQP10066.1 2-oxo acid dehydrogenase subunit E2 [Burkholderia cepacia]HDR9511272.1 2-oxo acid dehydrogenase subunit E2 [Burkholderia cepacia]
MIEFTLPSMGADMDEGTLLEWLVKPGDVVRKGQVVAIVDTSKAAVDVESWHDGTVDELLVEPGEKIPVGEPMATLLEPGEAPPAVRHARRAARPAAAAACASRRKISPAARKRAQQFGIDPGGIPGTGPEGAVTLADVERTIAAAAGPVSAGAPGERVAEMRRVIAAAMERSKREIPHYYVSETIPLGKALAWLADENAKRSITDRLLPAALLLKAVAVTLARFPELNGFYRRGVFEPARNVHLGVAISLRQGGLVAPALLDVGTKPLTQLMRELLDLTQRCRTGSLRSSELSESTITVTNLGDRGATEVFGVIYPPQVALVGFGRIAERPWAEDGALGIMPLTTASVSADHRVSDGHRGALFLVELGELLQHPGELNR